MATQEQLEYLDNLRDSGVVNMFGAAPYVAQEFDLSTKEARQVLKEWASTFSTRHPKGETDA